MTPLEGAALGYCSFPVYWLQTVRLATSGSASVSPYWLDAVLRRCPNIYLQRADWPGWRDKTMAYHALACPHTVCVTLCRSVCDLTQTPLCGRPNSKCCARWPNLCGTSWTTASSSLPQMAMMQNSWRRRGCSKSTHSPLRKVFRIWR